MLIFGEADRERMRRIEEALREIILRAEDRGRDSWGVVALRRNGEYHEVRRVGPPSASIWDAKLLPDDAVAAIFNTRAEPTTEYVKEKTPADIQPFRHGRIAVSHNGVIANDDELAAKYGVEKPSKIDSSVLPPILDKAWDGTLRWLTRFLRDEVVGSYALAILDSSKPGKMWLAANFKPLYVAWDHELKALFISSYDTHLADEDEPPWASRTVKRVEPYTAIEIGVDGTWRVETLWKRSETRRVLVVASGGLDSTTAAAKLRAEGYEVALLHINYRHRAEEREREAVRRIAEALQAPLIEIDTEFFKVVGRSPLLGEGEVSTRNGGRFGAEFAHEWVPARNLVFISLAVALAEAWGFDAVALGTNLEEAGAYPDNEPEFIRLLDRVLPYATGPQRRVRLIMPVGNLVKHEIVRLGLEVGAPLEHTWSCYLGGEAHCGRCGPCYMRRWAFKINGVRDPVKYALPPEEEEEFWRGTTEYRPRQQPQ